MTVYKPLTPEFRNDIQAGIDEQIKELNTCHDNAIVSAQKTGLIALKGLIKSLPDGWPMPITKSE